MALPRSRSALRAQVGPHHDEHSHLANGLSAEDIVPQAAIDAFGALAHPGRLIVFQTLVKAGPEGLAAGKIAEITGIVPQTLSGHLHSLTVAMLANSRRDGRRILYSCNRDFLTQMMLYFVGTCCNGSEVVLKPLQAQLVSLEAVC